MPKQKRSARNSENKAENPFSSLPMGADWGKHLSEIMDDLPPSVFAGMLSADGRLLHANQTSLNAIATNLDDLLGRKTIR